MAHLAGFYGRPTEWFVAYFPVPIILNFWPLLFAVGSIAWWDKHGGWIVSVSIVFVVMFIAQFTQTIICRATFEFSMPLGIGSLLMAATMSAIPVLIVIAVFQQREYQFARLRR
ncbi:hypothetical protein [Rubripirellula reticaptiva]|uniref:Uncharacterized protein n=1 Tax=Rubripirellula reticaptiva TaxID=2528013 RepID=A0A5C6F9P8_9BACT|nr:hypothetical protein [Rubripirellula reticaptiva]TWU57177.1 hypothetical protein Poly59_00830 [Rubripirellula reticaptiva]